MFSFVNEYCDIRAFGPDIELKYDLTTGMLTAFSGGVRVSFVRERGIFAVLNLHKMTLEQFQVLCELMCATATTPFLSCKHVVAGNIVTVTFAIDVKAVEAAIASESPA
jgi:hypothetical protein